MTTDERWCLPKSGWAPGAYDLVRQHLTAVEKSVCDLAHGYTEDRTPDGPFIVTHDDAERAIQEYEV